MSDNKNIICTYNDLIQAANDSKPIEVVGNWIVITVEKLKKGAFYVAPLYFWAHEDRPLRVEILKPGTRGELAFEKEFVVGRQMDNAGKDQWVTKRYKINKSRHDGKAMLRIGWPPDHPKYKTEIPFKLVAAPLTSKQLLKQARIDAGLCPTCSQPGEWITMAMVCKKHGIFLG
jgi:hypothetical protein